ncbi:MAG: hypothetical protein L0G80_15940 [Shewanella sp.]|nr:hypothetical protein [Shewanella sp.]MDN5501407.1 hypothetical protein [Shewanella sp.]MDN5529901.1 hypothetical protein [Shewanella sp.]
MRTNKMLCFKEDMDIGLRSELAFSIGEKQSPTMQSVDIWLGSVLITYFDNTAYLPAFVNALRRELANIEKGEVASGYTFFNLGPTTDDAVARAKIIEDKIEVSCVLNNGNVVKVILFVENTISAYKECIRVLST